MLQAALDGIALDFFNQDSPFSLPTVISYKGSLDWIALSASPTVIAICRLGFPWP